MVIAVRCEVFGITNGTESARNIEMSIMGLNITVWSVCISSQLEHFLFFIILLKLNKKRSKKGHK